MKPCKLVVRFEHEADPEAVMSAFASKWAEGGWPALRRFGRSGSGEVLSEKVIRRDCSFSPKLDVLDVVFRTGRGRKDDVLKLFFFRMNPKLDSDSFLVVDFRREDVGRAPGYDLGALAGLLACLVSAGPAWAGAVEFEEVWWDPHWQDLCANQDFFRRPALGWIFYLPRQYLKAKGRLPKWLTVLHELEHGLIVATSPEPLDAETEIQRHEELLAKLDPPSRRSVPRSHGGARRSR